ncbi:MAG: OmpH family outer membrane protein [Bacteroidales bacterium]|nr:OmpH family outer membrane protein [Bacteroidales bacterium]HOY38398.1 OmpH family outer membrane protein [Bacteroidales bacterium]HQP04334.1 OmpH family outer membrane protein [Bacteroidales bacterium]
MKKTILLLLVSVFSMYAWAQKYAYVDTEYILNNIPLYESAQEQLNELSEQWKAEVDAMQTQVDKMYKDFQAEKVLLTDELKEKREQEIVNKEREMRDLQKKYFGRDGMLFKKRQELIKPLQDDIYNAIKEIAVEGSYAVIFDTANSLNMLYTDPKYDKSDEVLKKMGYKN